MEWRVRRGILAGWLGVAVWLGGGVWGVTGSGEDPRRDASVEAVARVMPAVVNIGTETLVEVRDPLADLFEEFWGPMYRRRPPTAQYSLGSGVIIDESGWVLTNDHVTRRANRIWVKLSEELGGRTYEAERVAGSSRSDVALLRIMAEPGERFVAARFADEDDLLLGETVLALGNPFGLGGSVSRGILSSKSRRPPEDGAPLWIEDWLQTDAAINPGNSGGPLINLRGEVIGINVAVYRQGQGIGFAIPVKRVTEALADLFSPESRRLWFGARVRPAGAALRVGVVEPGSPAAAAGLEEGDLIRQINGRRPEGLIEFVRELMMLGDEEEVRLGYEREGVLREARVRLVREEEVFNARLIKDRTGLSVQELTRELAGQLGLRTTQGLLVAGVDPDSPAERLGIRRGTVIERIDGRAPDDVAAAAKQLYGKAAGETVQLVMLIQTRRGGMLLQQRVGGELRLR